MILEGSVINFLGDSITQGVGASCIENRYTDVLARQFGLKRANNYGISGTRIARQRVVTDDPFDQDFCKGYADGSVVLTELNEKIAAPGTAEKLAEVEAGLADGSIKVFDTSTFTVEGETLTSAFALDTDGDFPPDSEEAVFDGAFHESYFQSAPYFAIKIDGIEWLNSAF